jgi:hypothetical protein
VPRAAPVHTSGEGTVDPDRPAKRAREAPRGEREEERQPARSGGARGEEPAPRRKEGRTSPEARAHRQPRRPE